MSHYFFLWGHISLKLLAINGNVFLGEQAKFQALACAIGSEFAGVLKRIL